MSFDVCIIGAGVVGLSVALNVQRLMRLVNVTVVADYFGMETNTPVMESLFIPAPSSVEADIKPHIAMQWFTDAWEHHYNLATTDPTTSGNSLKNGTALWWHKGHHVLPQCVADYRLLSRDEMDEKEFNVAYGCEFTTVHVDLYDYLRHLLKEIRQNGGQLKHDTVFSFQELYGQYDVVVNCVGNRGRELKADNNLVYIRNTMLQGHVASSLTFELAMDLVRFAFIAGDCVNAETMQLQLRAMTIPLNTDDFLVTQDDVYICPHPRYDYCDVGFIKTINNHETEVDEDCQWQIKHRAAQYLPEIKECDVIKAWAEKRPMRFPILLEIEYLNCGGPVLPIVHNVGHGDKTISLAWGRGVEAAHLVQEVQRMVKPFAKKWQPYNKI